MRASCLGLACLALGACAADGEDPVPEGDAVLVLGSSADDGQGFVPLGDGSDAPLIAGAQGGFHVWVGIEVSGVSGPIALDRDARRVEDDALVLRAIRQVVEVPEDAMEMPWQKPVAVPSFMCPTPIGLQVYDREIELAVRMFDEDDQLLAEDTITVVPRCPTGELESFCLDICGG